MADFLAHLPPARAATPGPGEVQLWGAIEGAEPAAPGETFSRRMQRAVLARYLGVTAAQVRIDRRCARCGGPHGRPSVPGAGIDFSVSHSGGRVVIAVVGSERVGVDVQMPAAEISRHFLAKALDPAESAALEALPAASRLRALTQQWCRTEAAAKLTGVGVLAGVRAEPGAQRLPVSLVDLDLGGGLVGALASSRPIDRIRRGT